MSCRYKLLTAGPYLYYHRSRIDLRPEFNLSLSLVITAVTLIDQRITGVCVSSLVSFEKYFCCQCSTIYWCDLSLFVNMTNLRIWPRANFLNSLEGQGISILSFNFFLTSNNTCLYGLSKLTTQQACHNPLREATHNTINFWHF